MVSQADVLTIKVPSGHEGGVVVVTDKQFGAKGDGVTDDTNAILNAIAAASTVSVGAGTVYFPRPVAHYKITAPLNLPFAPGLRIVGESVATIIKQYTNNTPIFRISSDNMHSWEISNLQLGYANVQPSTNTAACPIYFVGNNSGGIQIYNFKLHSLTISGGCDAIGGDATSQYCAWGFSVRDFVVSGVSRSVCTILNSMATAFPNIHFDSVYVRADTMVGPLWNMQGAENCQMDAVEINVASLGPTLIREWGGGTYTIGAFKLEVGTYASTVNPMFDFSNSQATFAKLHIFTVTMNPTVGGGLAIFRLRGTNSSVKVQVYGLDGITVTAGTQYIIHTDGSPNEMTVDSFISAFPASVALLDNSNTASSQSVFVGAWARGRISADKGDANYNVVAGDPNTIIYSTALTAVRTVTLPGSFGNNLFDGLRYRIVRSGGGAFALNINDAQGPVLLDSIPSGKTGVIEYTYRRFSWVQTMKALI